MKAEEGSVDGCIYLQANKKGGGRKEFKTRIKDWQHNKADYSVDAAVIALPFAISKYDQKYFPHSMAATNEVIAKQSIGIGDVVVYPSLFTHHRGKARNLPILREGTLARMPQEEIPVTNFGPIEAYLIEARSIGGHSGAPVFVYLHPGRAVDNQIVNNTIFYWLGVMHGHFNEVLEEEAVEGEALLHKMNTGIAIVVPAPKVLDILNLATFADYRSQVVEKLNAAHLPTPDVS